MIKNISTNKFLRFIFEKYLGRTFACLWSLNSLFLLLMMSKVKIERKENFTYAKKKLGSSYFKGKFLEMQFNSTFWPLFHDF